MYKRILVVVDSDPARRAAVRHGVALASVHGAELVFFTVLPRYVMPVAEMPAMGLASPHEFQRAAMASAHRILAAAAAFADKAGVRSTAVVDAGPDDAGCIVEAARKKKCGLIVLEASGDNAVMRILSGSAVPGLITRAPVPVLVVPRRSPPKSGSKSARRSA